MTTVRILSNKEPMKFILDGWTYLYCGPTNGFVRYQTENKYSAKAEEARQDFIISNSEEATPTGGNDSY